MSYASTCPDEEGGVRKTVPAVLSAKRPPLDVGEDRKAASEILGAREVGPRRASHGRLRSIPPLAACGRVAPTDGDKAEAMVRREGLVQPPTEHEVGAPQSALRRVVERVAQALGDPERGVAHVGRPDDPIRSNRRVARQEGLELPKVNRRAARQAAALPVALRS